MVVNFGVDWAGHGWLVASAQDEARPQVEFHSTMFEVWNRLPPGGRMAIDIPIGLSTHGPRPCDQEAKAILGAWGYSVFYTPTREAVYASNIDQAKEEQSSLGYSIQNQAWAIGPRIREVDQLLRIHETEINTDQIIETHPEVVYAALNGGEPVGKSKKEQRGETDRFELLRPHLRDVKTVFRNATSKFRGPDYASKLARPDDILDAFAALLVARDGGRDPPRLPHATSPNRDDEVDRDCVIAYPKEVNWPSLPTQLEKTTE